MFNVGGGELLVIMLIALVVLGPQRLPDAARQIGKLMGEVRRVSSGFQSELKDALDAEPDAPQRRKEATPLAATVAEAEAATGPVARTNGDHADDGDGGDHAAGDAVDANGEAATAEAVTSDDAPAIDAATDATTADAGGDGDAPEAGEEAPPAARPAVAAPVADALDEIVAPLDDERAAS